MTIIDDNDKHNSQHYIQDKTMNLIKKKKLRKYTINLAIRQ